MYKEPKWIDQNSKVLDPQPTVDEIKSWGGEPRISDYENTINLERQKYARLIESYQHFLKDFYSVSLAFKLDHQEHRAFHALKDVIEESIKVHNQNYVSLAKSPFAFTQDELYTLLTELTLRIETCGASPELTDASCLSSDLAGAIGNKWNPPRDYCVKKMQGLLMALEKPNVSTN